MSAALFILHSPADQPLYSQLLRPQLTSAKLTLLDQAPAGAHARDERLAQLARADAALVLLSPELLAAPPSGQLETLQRRKAQGLPVVPVLLRPCLFDQHPFLSTLQVLPRDRLPLQGRADAESACLTIVQELLAQLPPRLSPSARAGRGHALSLVITCPSPGTYIVRYLIPQHPEHTTRPAPLPRLRDPSGEQLYRLLFPEDPTPLWRALFGVPAHLEVSPLRAGVRVRIVCSEPALRELPFQLTTYEQQPLRAYGWTFELSPQPDPPSRETLLAPVKLLLFLPGDARRLRAAVEEQLGRLPGQRLHPTHYRVVHDPAELPHHLHQLRPQILLCQGAATPEGYRGLPFAALAQLFASAHRPHLCYLGGDAPAGWPQAVAPLLDTPLVLLARPGAPLLPTETLVTTWLGRLLRMGQEPLQALHDVWPAPPAAPLLCHGNYHDMEVRREPAQAELPERHVLELDRYEARSMVDQHLWELIDSRQRRVEVLIACADQGNLLEEFPEQACDYVQKSRHERPERLQVAMPAHRADLEDALEQELRLQLGADPRTPLGRVLRGQLRQPPSRGAGVLFLDYGVFGAGHQEKLSEQDLSAVLRFARDRLDRGCPEDLRVVLYLGRLVPLARQAHFKDSLERLVRDDRLMRNERFRFTLLPPLDRVTFGHLHDFLSTPEKSGCPSSHAWDAAALIHAESDGVYERAVALLKRAFASSYEQLIAELRGPKPPPPAPEGDY